MIVRQYKVIKNGKEYFVNAQNITGAEINFEIKTGLIFDYKVDTIVDITKVN